MPPALLLHITEHSQRLLRTQQLDPDSTLDTTADRRRGNVAKKRVSFSAVSVRRFDLTCTGVVSCGPSIGLDWSFTDDRNSHSLDAYEETRVLCRKQRGEKGLWLSALQRKTILIQKHGYSPKDLMAVYQKRIDASRRWISPPRRNL